MDEQVTVEIDAEEFEVRVCLGPGLVARTERWSDDVELGFDGSGSVIRIEFLGTTLPFPLSGVLSFYGLSSNLHRIVVSCLPFQTI